MHQGLKRGTQFAIRPPALPLVVPAAPASAAGGAAAAAAAAADGDDLKYDESPCPDAASLPTALPKICKTASALEPEAMQVMRNCIAQSLRMHTNWQLRVRD